MEPEKQKKEWDSLFNENFDCNDYDDSHNELDCKHEFDLSWTFKYLDKKTQSLSNIETGIDTLKVSDSYSTSKGS